MPQTPQPSRLEQGVVVADLGQRRLAQLVGLGLGLDHEGRLLAHRSSLVHGLVHGRLSVPFSAAAGRSPAGWPPPPRAPPSWRSARRAPGPPSGAGRASARPSPSGRAGAGTRARSGAGHPGRHRQATPRLEVRVGRDPLVVGPQRRGDGAGHPVEGGAGQELVLGVAGLDVPVAVAPGAVLLDQPRGQAGRGVVQGVTDALGLGPVQLGVGALPGRPGPGLLAEGQLGLAGRGVGRLEGGSGHEGRVVGVEPDHRRRGARRPASRSRTARARSRAPRSGSSPGPRPAAGGAPRPPAW